VYLEDAEFNRLVAERNAKKGPRLAAKLTQ
jgi:uncharacterized small protein (DUF1192 family)